MALFFCLFCTVARCPKADVLLPIVHSECYPSPICSVTDEQKPVLCTAGRWQGRCDWWAVCVRQGDTSHHLFSRHIHCTSFFCDTWLWALSEHLSQMSRNPCPVCTAGRWQGRCDWWAVCVRQGDTSHHLFSRHIHCTSFFCDTWLWALSEHLCVWWCC